MYVYYLTRGFIASTGAFNLPTREFELVTRGFELVTRNSCFTFTLTYSADRIYISCLIHTTRLFHNFLGEDNRKLRSIYKEYDFCFADNGY